MKQMMDLSSGATAARRARIERTPVENGREIVKYLSNAELVVVPGAGHDFDVWSVVGQR
jgi:pimeloyl-ACP methyl ester carboxylesterase